METQHPTQTARSVLNDWVGHRVIIKYLGGPVEPFDPNGVKGLSAKNEWKFAPASFNCTGSATWA